MDLSESVWDFIQKISFPRFVGSDGHHQVKKEIINKMNQLRGMKFEEQSFPAYSKSFARTKIIQIFMGLLICVLPWFYFQYNLIAALSTTILLFIFALALSPLAHADHQKMMQQADVIQGENLIFTLDPKITSPVNRLIILAHYDSIARPFPIILTVILFVGGYLGGYLFLLQNIIYLIATLVFDTNLGSWISFLWGIGIGLILIIFTFDHPTNNSPGTLDNGSGLAAMYYLAQQYVKHPLNQTQILFVATDAEELGNLGGYAYLKQYKENLNNNSTRFLILDSIGCKKENRMVAGSRFPKKRFSPVLEKIGEQLLISEPNKYPLKKFYFPPLLAIQSDHNPVLENGYEFLLFGGLSLDYHTPRDNMDTIDKPKFFSICEFLEQMIKKIDQDQK